MEHIERKIQQLLENKFLEEEFSSCFLVETILSKKKLQVFIDSDEGINYKVCMRISRHLEAYLDESGDLGEKYILEVSSPGADRPVKMLRQLKKYIGRKFRFIEKDEPDIKQQGELVSIEEEVLEFIIKEKKKEAVTKAIKFEDLHEIKIVITF